MIIKFPVKPQPELIPIESHPLESHKSHQVANRRSAVEQGFQCLRELEPALQNESCENDSWSVCKKLYLPQDHQQ